MRLLGEDLLFQGDFLGQRTGFGHDAKPHSLARRNEGIAGPIRQRLPLTLQARKLPFGAGFHHHPFGNAVQPCHAQILGLPGRKGKTCDKGLHPAAKRRDMAASPDNVSPEA
ncbi:hypothetical protein GCM10007291_04780 [Gemmobacter nanjingensis]|uniref:Uncharacterized protein n=1 Tax=Gemmobacter nanjingensis TaxID=488454 RepID=A0ABQ3F7C4_9RHOB|nr:hypothetical protein GCM10007291_04780 [Gemmobacter nanjingensis]